MKKKLMSLFIAILMIFSTSFVYVNAEEVNGKCGEYAFWVYDDVSKTVTVSGSGTLTSAAEWENLDFVNFVISDGISYIPGAVLRGHHSVEIISISGSVKCISDYTFTGFPNLKKIELGYGIESLEVGPFANNPALESVNVPGSVKTFMGCTFANCKSLKDVTIEEGVEEITNAMFFDCIALEYIVLPESIKIIREEAFQGCKSLKEISIPNSTTRIYYDAFDGTALEKITINNKNCVIDFDENTIPESAVIYGYSDSAAEAYANQYNRKFVALDEDDLFSAFVRFFESFITLIKTFFNTLLKEFSVM